MHDESVKSKVDLDDAIPGAHTEHIYRGHHFTPNTAAVLLYSRLILANSFLEHSGPL